MSRRNQLKVDTFPFLAVLLCAMGSLILVLLVMDRRSKLAARQRAMEQYRQTNDDHDRQRTRHREEYEAKKRTRDAAWQKKRDALRTQVDREEQALEAELQEVQRQLADAARRLREEEENVRKLRSQLNEEHDRLAAQKQDLAGAREEASALASKLGDADRARERLTDQVAQLEETLRKLKESRRRDANTYSIVPYRGKFGDNRRPIYVECTERGLVFHPDKLSLVAPSNDAIRQEVKKRVEQQKTRSKPGEKPYLLVLVRPSGVWRYYDVTPIAAELRVDFGFEFVDQDWELNVPDEDVNAPASQIASQGNSSLRGGAGSGIATGTLVSQPSANLPPPAEAFPRGSGVSGASGKAPWQLPTPAGGSSSAGTTRASASGAGVQLKPPVTYATPPASTNPSASNDAIPLVQLTPPVGKPNLGSPTEFELPPIGDAAKKTEGNAPPANRTNSSSGSGSSPSGETTKFGLPTPDPKPVPMRPARIHHSGEITIFVECRNDVVIVYPARKQIGIDSLNHTPLHNPLTQAVKQTIAQAQARAKATSQSPRFNVRFLVHPGCDRTYHLAYPPLETISIPKSRYNLMADDSVARIVAGY